MKAEKKLGSPGGKGWQGKLAEKLFFLKGKGRGYLKTGREILYGMTLHGLDLELRKERGNLDHFFKLVVFGDLVGLPLLPPYYTMRLLPYILPSVDSWKRNILREKDLTDHASVDL